MDSEYARLSTVNVPGVPLSLRRRKTATNFAEFPSDADEDDGEVPPVFSVNNSDDDSAPTKDKVKKLARKTKKFAKKTYKMIPEPIKSHLIPPKTRYQCLEFLFIRLPILEWVWRYKPRQIIGDTVAGVVVGFAHIPEALGIAVLAGVPPILGLYTSIVPVFTYAVFGTSNYLSIGTYSLIAVTAGETVEVFTSFESPCVESVNMTLPDTPILCADYSVNIAITLSLSCGLFLLAMGILQLGFLNYLLSEAMLSGFTTGAAISTIIAQTQFVFGFPQNMIILNSTNFFTPRQVVLFCELLFNGHVEWASLIIGIIVIIFLIAVKIINYFLRKKVKRIPLVIPGSLLALIVTTAISFVADFPQLFGISVVGNTSTVFERSMTSVSLPPFTGDHIDRQLMVNPDFILNAFLLALLIYVLSSSHARVLAKSTGDIIHNHQELIAYGMCNTIGSLFGTIPTASNISRALIQLSFGGKTQLAGIIAGFVVLFFSLFSAPLFSFLPLATLAAVIIVGVDVLLLQFLDLKKFWKLSKWDVITWIVTFLSVIIVNMKIGLLIGFIMSLLIIVLRTVLPVSEALGVATAWDSITRQYESVEKLDGILIYRFQAPLHFANVAVFKSRLQKIASVQLSKQKGNFYDSDGFIPRLVRMCRNRRLTTTGCACCCGKGNTNRFHRLQGDPRFTSSPTQEGLLSDPSPEMKHEEGHRVKFRSPTETSSEHEHKSNRKPQRKTYQAFGSAKNKEDLLLHRREASYEEVVIKPRVNRSPLPRNTEDRPQLENKGVSKEKEGGAGRLVPAIIVKDVDAITGSGDENNAENSTLEGGEIQRSAVQQVPIDVRSVPREPNYVNVECVRQNRNTGRLEGGDFNVTENDYDNLPLNIPQRYQKAPVGGGDGERDYYNVDHLHRGESMKRSSAHSEHSEHSNVDDLCQIPQMATIYVRHAIKRKLVQGENIGDFDDFEELSTSFVRKLEHAREHPYHTIILDCGPISFIDSAGALLLHQLIKDLSKLGIEFLLAAPSKYFITSFERLGFCRRCSEHFIFPTIQSAVEYAISAQRQERPLSALLEGSHDEDNPNSIGYVERHVVSNRRFDFESSFSWLGNSGSERHERSREIPSHHRSREDVFTRTV